MHGWFGLKLRQLSLYINVILTVDVNFNSQSIQNKIYIFNQTLYSWSLNIKYIK